MQNLSYENRVPLPFADRTPRLMTLGVILLVGAAGSGCIVALLPIARFVPQAPGTPVVPIAQLVLAGVLYATLAAVLGALGYGLVRRRRWARPLTMILATHTLVFGAVTLVCAAIAVPLTAEAFSTEFAAAQGSAAPAGNLTGLFIGIAVASVVFILLTLIALPLTYLLLLRHPEVLLTVQHYDGRTRWTDRVPPAVLNMTVTLGVAAVGVAAWAAYATVPLFNTVVRGAAAVALVLLAAAALAIATWQAYRLRPRGWWLGMTTIVIMTLLLLPSIFMMPLADYYAALGVEARQIGPFLNHPWLARASTAAGLVLLSGVFVAYMLRAKPAFDAAVRARATGAHDSHYSSGSSPAAGG
ncbi:MAG TPA: hypothetical protein VF624_01160 [Tepidisphaeraceae bacterium]